MRPKDVRQKPTPYIPPHIETKTPAQCEASIRTLLRQVEATTEPQYLMSRSSDKAATKIGKVIKGHLSRKDTRNEMLKQASRNKQMEAALKKKLVR
jgi:hypothetical protein